MTRTYRIERLMVVATAILAFGMLATTMVGTAPNRILDICQLSGLLPLRKRTCASEYVRFRARQDSGVGGVGDELGQPQATGDAFRCDIVHAMAVEGHFALGQGMGDPGSRDLTREAAAAAFGQRAYP